MIQPVDDDPSKTLEVAIRQAIDTALEEGANQAAEQLKAVLQTIPRDHGGMCWH
jgi:hypothetical protein